MQVDKLSSQAKLGNSRYKMGPLKKKNCGVSVLHMPEGHGHETHGHKTTTSSEHGERREEEKHKGIL